jgi:hypothetical protein
MMNLLVKKLPARAQSITQDTTRASKASTAAERRGYNEESGIVVAAPLCRRVRSSSLRSCRSFCENSV